MTHPDNCNVWYKRSEKKKLGKKLKWSPSCSAVCVSVSHTDTHNCDDGAFDAKNSSQISK